MIGVHLEIMEGIKVQTKTFFVLKTHLK